MNSSFFCVLLIATCILTAVVQSDVEPEKLKKTEIEAYYTRFFKVIPKMIDSENKMNSMNVELGKLNVVNNKDVSKLTEINNSLNNMEKENEKSLKSFTKPQFDIWNTVIGKLNTVLNKEDIKFGFDYNSRQYATVLNEENIRKIENCPDNNITKINVTTCKTALQYFITNNNTTVNLTKEHLLNATTALNDLFTYKYSHIFIDCTPTAPISADGRTLLELAQSIAKKGIVISPWKNIITIGVAVLGTLSTLTLIGARFMMGGTSS